MKVRFPVLLTILLLVALGLAQFAMPTRAFASGTVGDGSAGSCTEAALLDAISANGGGGLVTFNCGLSAHTITVESTIAITANTQIDGDGLITISGGGDTQVFTVDSGVTLTLSDLTVSDGYKAGNGGALYMNSTSTVTITNSTFTNNHTVGGYGGAIYVNDGTLSITNSTFSNNGADVSSLDIYALGGGAIQNNDGAVTIRESTFNGNSVTGSYADGGAIYSGDLDGAGHTPDADVEELTIGNSTFYNNDLVNDTASSSGGAIRSNGTITLAHNTFSNNDGGIWDGVGGNESGAVTLANGSFTMAYNIFANSTSAATAYDCGRRSTTTTQVASVGNLIETTLGCSASFAVDPNLGPFQNNGGPTYTMAPNAGSSAIDTAATCATGITFDQRGVTRPQGGATKCDIGAVERDTTAPTVTINQAGGQSDPTATSPVLFTVVFSEPVVNFTTGDVNLSTGTVGGTLTGTVTGGPTTFTVSVSGMTTPGNVIAKINAGAATDIALNNNTASTSTDNTVAYDATGPAVTINKAVGQDDPTNSSTVNFKVLFDESVTGFDETDITFGGTASPATAVVTGSGTTYNVAVTGMTQDGTVTASVNEGAVSDALGNPSSASTTSDNEVLFDTTAPTVSSIVRVGDTPTNDGSVQFTVTFDDSVSGVATSNFNLTTSGLTGTSVSSVSGSGNTRTVTVNTGSGNGTLRLNMANGTGVTDLAGNAISGLPFTTGEEYTVDKIVPTVTINKKAGQADPAKTSPIEFTVEFSETVTGFDETDLTLTSGTAVVTGSGTTYNVAVSGMNQGDLTATVEVGAASDAAGNTNGAGSSTDNTVAYDSIAPTVTIEKKVGQSDPAKASPIEFTVVFSETVTGFDETDLTVTSGTAVISGSGPTYTVSVSGMDQGNLTVAVTAAAVSDAAGNTSAASTSTDNTVAYDSIAPTATISQAVGQPDPTNELTIDFKVLFSETISGFTTGDVVLTGTAGATTVTITELAPNNGTTFNVGITNMTQNGTVIINIPSAAVSDAAGNTSAAATVADNQVTFDSVSPTVTINLAAGQNATAGFSPANFAVVFSSPVIGFVTGDVTLSGTSGATTATVTEVSPNDGTTYNVAVTGMTSNGTATISIPAGVAQDVASNGNLASPNTNNTVTFTFVIPGVPTLVAPLNGATVGSLQPLFDWNDSVPGAQYYRIQIATTQTFVPASIVIDQSNIPTSQFTPVSNLTAGVRYYWRVKSYSAIGGALANWSAVRSLRTPLETPVLASPVAGALLTTDRPSFDWSDVPGATGYTLQIATANTFTSGLLVRTMTTSSYDMNVDLTQDKVLFWRVQAKTAVITSSWSAIESFKSGNPPTVPVLSAPTMNSLLTTLTPLFNWGNVTTPIGTTFKHYQLQVADNAAFNVPAIDEDIAGLTASQYQAIVGDSLQPNVQYYWRVRSVNTINLTAVDHYSAWSKVFIYRSAMTPPELLLPANTASPALTTRVPSFDWQDANGATGYQLNISVNSSMASPIVNVSTVSSQYVPTASLPANTTLYWRVRATGLNGPSLWSQTWTFKTGNPPSVPALSAPASNALTSNFTPLFDWANSTLPVGTTFKYYEIQVDDNSDFQSLAFQSTTTLNDLNDSQYQTTALQALNPNSTYYWRVRAFNTDDHQSAWSTVRSLRTTLQSPTVVAPTDGSTINAQPVFEWVAVPGATGYTIQVSTSPMFSSYLLNVTISNPAATTYDPTMNFPITPNVIYWRIRANGTSPSVYTVSDFVIVP